MKKGDKWTPEERAKRAVNRAHKKQAELDRQKISDACDLLPAAMKFDPIERQAIAEKLENQAAQLRDFKQRPIPFEKSATVRLRPKVKQAIIAFADRFGAQCKAEDEKLDCGIRWFLEGALPRFEDIVSATARHAKYRDDEGFEDSVLSEKIIGDAIDNWKAKQVTDKGEDDGQVEFA